MSLFQFFNKPIWTWIIGIAGSCFVTYIVFMEVIYSMSRNDLFDCKKSNVNSTDIRNCMIIKGYEVRQSELKGSKRGMWNDINSPCNEHRYSNMPGCYMKKWF